jgi:GT2 family glycosyltransferase
MQILSCSIVIATYNRAASLLDLMRDLSAQRGAGEFDVVVVDDGSRAPVRPQLEAQRFPFRLTVLEQANSGQAVARHRGVGAAQGDVVIIVDDDMALPADFVAGHLDCHRSGADVVLGLIRPAEQLEAMPLFERFHAAQLAGFVADMRAGKPIPGAALCTGNVSFRKRWYERVGGFDLTLKRSEDRDLGIRLQQAGARFTFSERACTTHRSDHADLEVWLKRAYLYGVYDAKIGRKYPDDAYNDPWHYILLIHPLSRSLVLSTVVAPHASRRLSRLAFSVADRVAKRGLERLAIRGATVAYTLEYFRGVRSEYAGVGDAARGFLKFLRTQQRTDRTQGERLATS